MLMSDEFDHPDMFEGSHREFDTDEEEMDELVSAISKLIATAESHCLNPRMLVLLSQPYPSHAVDMAVASRSLKRTATIMERALTNQLLGCSKPADMFVGNWRVDMNSRQWWLSAMSAGVMPANRVPVLVPSKASISPTIRREIETRWKPFVKSLAARCELVVVVGSGYMNGYEDLMKWPNVVHVEQPTYGDSDWSWPLAAMIVWRSSLLKLGVLRMW